MNRDYEREDLIDLGAVSVETKGGAVGSLDTDNTFYPGAGLTDE